MFVQKIRLQQKISAQANASGREANNQFISEEEGVIIGGGRKKKAEVKAKINRCSFVCPSSNLPRTSGTVRNKRCKTERMKSLYGNEQPSEKEKENLTKVNGCPQPIMCYQPRIRNRTTETMVLVRPTQASKGMSFIRSPMLRLTEPPVAWKKEP